MILNFLNNLKEFALRPDALIVISLIGFAFGSASGHYLTKNYYKGVIAEIQSEYTEYKLAVLETSTQNSKVALEQAARMMRESSEALRESQTKTDATRVQLSETIRRIKSGELEDGPASESLSSAIDSLRDNRGNP